MRINEQWEQLRKELNEQYNGIKIQEFECIYSSNSSLSRGPHVRLLIPDKVEQSCPCCNTILKGRNVPKPLPTDISKLINIVDKYLCRIIGWDGNIKYGKWSGEHVGWFYEIILDKHDDKTPLDI